MKIRSIELKDEASVVELLVEGFPSRDADYWTAAFQRLAQQVVPVGHLQFGSVMEEAGKLVGVLLVIWTPPDVLPEGQLRANLSSWYVKPEFRSFAAMLLAKVSRSAAVTYLNVSAAENTIEICTALGFKKYSSGQAVCVPLLSRQQSMNKVSRFETGTSGLAPEIDRLMLEHTKLGCLGYVGTFNRQPSPFLFVRRRVQKLIPAGQLIYCESPEAFQHNARALGWNLVRQGLMLTICDSNGRIPGVVSHYFPGKIPKYFKGSVVPRLGDLSFTEIALFGI